MEAFIVHEIPLGLGKKSVIILPDHNNGNSMVISIPYSIDLVLIERELGCFELTKEDGFKKIELADDLAQKILMSEDIEAWHNNNPDKNIIKDLSKKNRFEQLGF